MEYHSLSTTRASYRAKITNVRRNGSTIVDRLDRSHWHRVAGADGSLIPRLLSCPCNIKQSLAACTFLYRHPSSDSKSWSGLSEWHFVTAERGRLLLPACSATSYCAYESSARRKKIYRERERESTRISFTRIIYWDVSRTVRGWSFVQTYFNEVRSRQFKFLPCTRGVSRWNWISFLRSIVCSFPSFVFSFFLFFFSDLHNPSPRLSSVGERNFRLPLRRTY